MLKGCSRRTGRRKRKKKIDGAKQAGISNHASPHHEESAMRILMPPVKVVFMARQPLICYIA